MAEGAGGRRARWSLEGEALAPFFGDEREEGWAAESTLNLSDDGSSALFASAHGGSFGCGASVSRTDSQSMGSSAARIESPGRGFGAAANVANDQPGAGSEGTATAGSGGHQRGGLA